MPTFTDDQLAKYSNAVWDVVVDYPAGSVVAEHKNLDVDGHMAMVYAVAEAAVTDVLQRMIAEREAALKSQTMPLLQVSIENEILRIKRYLPTPAPTASEGAETDE